MMAQPPDVIDRLAKVCGLLGSNQDGERSAAAHQATKILLALGLTWRDVIEAAGPRLAEHLVDESDPPRMWSHQLKICRVSSRLLNEWERSFITNLRQHGYAPTEKQLAVLDRLYRKVTAA